MADGVKPATQIELLPFFVSSQANTWFGVDERLAGVNGGLKPPVSSARTDIDGSVLVQNWAALRAS